MPSIQQIPTHGIHETEDSVAHGPLRVIIVGAGLAGLAAAIGLRQSGHHVTILERSRLAAEYGAAINVPPNALATLKHLGIDPEEVGAVELEWFITYNKDGSSVEKRDLTQESKHWRHKYLLGHRRDLHNQLKQVACASDRKGTPVELRTGSSVVAIDPQEGSVTLADGTKLSCNLVIGADGINSRCRDEISTTKPFGSGKSAYRFLIQKSAALADPELVDLVGLPGANQFWIDEKRRIITYPTRNNEILNFVCICPDGSAGKSEGAKDEPVVDNMLNEYSGFDERVLKLLKLADGSSLKIWKLMDMKQLDTWHSGRLCLIGDAAHPFLPYLGQGGAQAMEDGVSLGVLLPMGTRPNEINARLELFEKCRKHRAETIRQATREAGGDVTADMTRVDHATKMIRFFREIVDYDEHESSTAQLKQFLTQG